MVHKPDLSLERLTPTNCSDYLFDDVLWTEKAAEEHELFETILKKNGVEVYLLSNLLQETMLNRTARKWLLNKIIKRLHYDSTLGDDLYVFLSALDAESLARYLIGGLTWEEMKMESAGLVSQTLVPEDFVLPPLPNHLFTRDTSCWIGQGVSINPMHWPVRRGETINMSAIYKFHPMFSHADFDTWYDGTDVASELPSIEGGDVLVINSDCVLIGMGERTTPEAIEHLAKVLFEHEVKKQVIAIEIPKDRASMHLDTVMTMLDHDTFCVAFPCDTIRSWSIVPGKQKNKLKVKFEKDVFKAVAKVLGEKTLKLITPGGDVFAEQREQWTDASNLLAISPGVVIGYDRNVNTNEKLEKAGIKVIGIEGSELGRGRGGARCMSCPFEREDL